MHRIAVVVFTVAVFLGSAAAAQVLTDVAHLNNMRLGSRVVLEGHIAQHIRSDYYKFQDETGSVRVEIERWVSRGRIFRPNDKVRVYGEISRGFFGRYVEATRVTLLK